MDEIAEGRIEALHAARLGCEVSTLREPGVHVVASRAPALQLLARGRVLVVAGPRLEAEVVAALTGEPPRLPDPSALRARLGPAVARIVGPVFLGYLARAPEAPEGAGVARAIVAADASGLARLRDAARPDEWEHAGFTNRRPVAGVFAGERLVAAAGFEVLGGVVAHLGVLAHPAFRGRGAGSLAVAAAAALAAEAGLLLQYQTLESNAPSRRIAAKLGFGPWARSLAVRLSAESAS